jgi:tetratricopeptide (TPR) repeat protein
VVERAEGIPLYAVETLRMLQDRGALVLEGARYVVKGDVSHLEVPETLHALVASRLDGLSASERSLLQDASVLGQSFTAAALAAVSGLPEGEVTKTLDGLVAKQLLARDDDPRSPERGQYLFLQALLRTVAYGTLARRSRKAKHLAAARHLEQTWPGEARDIAEVLASHYLEAIHTDPEAEDVAILRGLAREKLIAAGQAAASLALGPEADRYFGHAAQLAEHDSERAELIEQAGHALWRSGDGEAAEQRLRNAIELYQRTDANKGNGATVALAKLLRHYVGRLDDARSLLEPFLAGDGSADAVIRAEALAELSAVLAFAGELDEALPLLEGALTVLEHEQAWAALADALVTRGVYLMWRGRQQEGTGVLRHALSIAEEHDASSVALRARMNLTQVSLESDQLTRAVDQAHEVVTIARERGDRALERKAHGILVWPLTVLGRWDEALSVGLPLIAEEHYVDALFAAASLVWIALARGDEATIDRCRSLAIEGRRSTYVDRRVCAESVLAREAVEGGDPEEALRLTQNARSHPGISGDALRESYAISVEAAMTLEDEGAIAEVEAFVATLPSALATPLLRSGRARLQAELAHRAGDDARARGFEDEAISLQRSVGVRALLVSTLLDRARRHHDRDALAEARTICEDLHATRWLERVDGLSGVAA